MTLTVYTDGGALNNPGPAASAYVIYKDDKNILFQEGVFLGPQTNNYAEYNAVVLALKKIKALLDSGQARMTDVKKIVFFSDSKLLVSQLNGLYRVKNGVIREFILKIRILEQEVNLPISYTHIYREQNTVADSLVKRALGR